MLDAPLPSDGVVGQSSVRRRSSGHSPNLSLSFHSYYDGIDESAGARRAFAHPGPGMPRVQVEDYDVPGGTPTVVLRGRDTTTAAWNKSPRLPPLPSSTPKLPSAVSKHEARRKPHVPAFNLSSIRSIIPNGDTIRNAFRSSAQVFESDAIGDRPLTRAPEPRLVRDNRRDPLKTSSYKAFPLAARFTRKFPLPLMARSRTHSESENAYLIGFDKRGTWTPHKWVLFISVISVLCYSMVALLGVSITWFRAWQHASVMLVADNDLIILTTLAASTLLFSASIGVTGVMLNSRPILAFYTLLLWPSLISILVVGYTAYKREHLALDRKLNLAWSEYYDDMGRLIIQDALHCCGFYNPLHAATFSKRCFPRTTLPGCKGKLLRFERENLTMIWTAVFSVVPLHLANIVVALLCSNHINRSFGKGLTPQAYRLHADDIRANAHAILTHFLDTDVPGTPEPSLHRVSAHSVLVSPEPSQKDFPQPDSHFALPRSLQPGMKSPTLYASSF